jgi:hypothetical protein
MSNRCCVWRVVKQTASPQVRPATNEHTRSPGLHAHELQRCQPGDISAQHGAQEGAWRCVAPYERARSRRRLDVHSQLNRDTSTPVVQQRVWQGAVRPRTSVCVASVMLGPLFSLPLKQHPASALRHSPARVFTRCQALLQANLARCKGLPPRCGQLRAHVEGIPLLVPTVLS